MVVTALKEANGQRRNLQMTPGPPCLDVPVVRTYVTSINEDIQHIQNVRDRLQKGTQIVSSNLDAQLKSGRDRFSAFRSQLDRLKREADENYEKLTNYGKLPGDICSNGPLVPEGSDGPAQNRRTFFPPAPILVPSPPSPTLSFPVTPPTLSLTLSLLYLPSHTVFCKLVQRDACRRCAEDSAEDLRRRYCHEKSYDSEKIL